jgi:hypothetical protein
MTHVLLRLVFVAALLVATVTANGSAADPAIELARPMSTAEMAAVEGGNLGCFILGVGMGIGCAIGTVAGCIAIILMSVGGTDCL